MAITDAWTAIATTQTDKDSPLNETLFNALRGNGYHNYDWIGKDYTPADNHDHDGVNSKSIIASGSSEVSTTSDSGATLSPTTTGRAFYPQIKAQHDYRSAGMFSSGAYTSSESYVNRIRMITTNSDSAAYARFTYIQASPPYPFMGSDDFGHFVFLLRKKSDGRIVSSSCAPDPVWEGPHSPLPKGHPARMALIPHPFADYYAGAPLPDDEEIVLVDLRHLQESITHRPRATAHAALCARRAEFAALGIAEQEIAQYEAASAAQMEAEADAHDKAASDIDTLDGSMPRLIAQAPETRPTLKAVVDVRADYFAPTKAQLQSFWLARKRILRKQAGNVTKIEKIQAEAEARGSSLLQEINEGRVPDAIATKELPKNDRDKLPNVPAFRDRVRVLRA